MSNAYTPSGDTASLIQAYLQYLMQGGAMQQQQQPWQGAADPDMLSELTFGYDPTQMQDYTLPTFPGTYNDRQVGSIEEQAKQVNVMKNMADLTADPMVAMLFGGGGYSADAFAPEVTRELIPQPETQRFQQWLNQGGDTFEGRVARAVQNGRAPRSAIIELRQIYEAGMREGATADQQQAADQVRLMLAPGYERFDETTGQPYADAPPTAPDWGQAYRDADDLVAGYREEQKNQPGPIGEVRDDEGNLISAGGEIVMGDDGQMYRVTTTPSPLAEKYHELGIPLPTEEYEPGDLLGADWQQAEQSYLSSIPEMDDVFRQLEQDRNRASQLATGFENAPLQEFYDRGSVPGLAGDSAIPATGAAPAPAPDGQVHPVDATTTATQDLVDEAMGSATPDDMIAFINAHQGEFSIDQLHDMNARVESNMSANRGNALELDWGRVQGTIDHRIKEVTPPDAVAPEAMTLAARAAGTGQNQQILDALPFFRGNGTLGQDINDVVKNDPQALAKWLMTNWSSMSDDQRRDATTFVDITAGEQGMNLATLSDPESVRQRGMWQSLRDQMDQLQGGTNVAEWNTAQGDGNAAHGFAGGAGGAATLRTTADLAALEPLINQMAAKMTGSTLMPRDAMLGGQVPAPEPQPGTPEWWAAQSQNQYDQPGAMGPPTVPNPNQPQTAVAPDFYAYQGGYSPQGPQPDPQQLQQIMGQQPAGALGSPAWQNLLAQSINSSGQNLLPPSQNERNQILGQTPQQPQGGTTLGIGDYLSQYVLGGGTRPQSTSQQGPPPGDMNSPEDLASFLASGGQQQGPVADPLQSAAWQAVLERSRNKTGAMRQNATPVDANTLAGMAAMAAPTSPQARQQGPPPGDMNSPAELAAFLASGQGSRRGELNMNDVLAMGPPSTSGPLPALTTTDLANVFDRPSSGGSDTRPSGGSLWDQLQPVGKDGQRRRPDQATAQAALRFMLGRGDEDGGSLWGQLQGNDKRGGKAPTNGKTLAFNPTSGLNRRDTAVLRQRNQIRDIDRQSAWARYDENMRHRNVYGRDYYMARGYTDALRRAGVTPSAVAAANRTGGINRMLGRA